MTGRRPAAAPLSAPTAPGSAVPRSGASLSLLAALLAAAALAAAASLAAPAPAAAQPVQPDFTIDDALSSPLPSALTAGPDGETVAWVQNAEGVRNVWVASAPDWEARRLTSWEVRDGQPIGDLAFTPDGSRLLFVRAGTRTGRA